MTFSNVNVFNSSFKAISASTQSKSDSGFVKGGAFAPNALETISIMRASFDEQWENAYIIKYQALMQNRLNALKQKLQGAYNNVVQQATSQQIRENGSTNEISATTDVYGRMLPGTQTGATGDVNQAFKGLKYYSNSTELDAGDGMGQYDQVSGSGSYLDGIPSYYIKDDTYQFDNAGTKISLENKVYEMRKLYNSGAAMQIANTMKVTFRAEEVLSKAVDNSSILAGISKSDNPAYLAGQKIAEYGAEIKTGGFWTTVNYLYNFAPRELKYSYATAYSTTTEEAGTRNIGDTQATLFSKKLLDGRDAQDTATGDVATDDDYTMGAALDGNVSTSAGNYPAYGARIKWASSVAEEGYSTERNTLSDIVHDSSTLVVIPTFPFVKQVLGGQDGTNVNNDIKITTGIDDRLITRRTVDNDAEFSSLRTGFNAFNDVVKGNDAPIGTTPANPWTGYMLDPVTNLYTETPASGGGNQQANKMKIFGTEEGGVNGIKDRLIWQYEHDGVGAYDQNRDSEINALDKHVATAAFINHYQVVTQDVELNSNPDSYGRVLALGHTRKNLNTALDKPYEFVDLKNNVTNVAVADGLDDETGQTLATIDKLNLVGSHIFRSGGIDASADHVFADTLDASGQPVYDADGRLVMHRNDVAKDGDGQTENEKILLAGSSKVSKNFTPVQVENMHSIRSYNGQTLGANGGNIQISAENANSEPVVLAEYEGFNRAKMMSTGLASDKFNDYGSQTRTYDAAVALKNKLEAEINASSMVDTDWHYSEYNTATNPINPAFPLVPIYEGIMFRNIKQISFNDPDKGSGTLDVFYDPKKRDDPKANTFQFVNPTSGEAAVVQGASDDTFNNVNVGFRKTFTLESKDFQTISYEPKQEPFFVNTPIYKPRDVFISVSTRNASSTDTTLIVNGNIVQPTAAPVVAGADTTFTYNIGQYLQTGDNVIASQMLFNSATTTAVGNQDFFSMKSGVNDKDITNWVSSKLSTERTKTGDEKSTELTKSSNGGVVLSGWQSKIMTNLITPTLYSNIYTSNFSTPAAAEKAIYLVNNITGKVVADVIAGPPAPAFALPGTTTLYAQTANDIPMSERAYNEYVNAVKGLGSDKTATKVKDTNAFAKMLTEAMNSKEYRDIFTLGLWNSSLGKDISLQVQVASPSGGNVVSTVKVKYNPINGMFSLIQSKWDASASPQQS